MSKPLVYVASPYTKGDVGLNVHFQCAVFDRLLDEGDVTPLVPLWSHFQHTVKPRQYTDWLQYDFEIISRCDACLRLNAVVKLKGVDYNQEESSGADGEVDFCIKKGIPVFYSFEDLSAWASKREKCNG